jgi:hypothetical protein
MKRSGIKKFGKCFGTEDFNERTKAFLEKRKAFFTGNRIYFKQKLNSANLTSIRAREGQKLATKVARMPRQHKEKGSNHRNSEFDPFSLWWHAQNGF